MSFDVSGVLKMTLDQGDAVEGPQLDGEGALLLDDEGRPVRRGEIIATIDETRFRQAVEAAELAIETTKRRIESLRVELQTVIVAQKESADASVEAARADVDSARETVKAAESDLDLAETTVERDRSLIASGAIAQSVLDQSEAEFRTATATLAKARSSLDSALQGAASALASVGEIEGTKEVREADLLASEAELEELVVKLEQARTDLDSCTLRAPFSGRITQKYVSKGDYVVAGESIVQLILISPVKVILTASSEQERKLPLGAGVPVYPDLGEGADSQIMGTVYEKASVADSGTRTFRVGIIVPNQLLEVAKGAEATDFRRIMPVTDLPDDQDGALHVGVDCVFEERGETYVLRIPGLQILDKERSLGDTRIPEQVRVELSEDWAQVDAWTLRRLAERGDLELGDVLLRRPTASDRDGVRLVARNYALRTGDVVRVGLDLALPPAGLWIPVTAILERSGDYLVFLVEDGRLREVSVDVHEASGELRRVTSPELAAGASFVSEGVNFVRDGDAVRIFDADS
ncbi:MAG: HlyD family efflux transporter periplasmic adaptor subunit [Planctomycetota bacterium]